VAPTPPPVQTASTTDVSSLEPSFRVLFDDNSATISDTGRAPLEELSKKMQESEDLRVQLLAYASGTSETASQARRLSLSRALAVRSFLISQGVRSTRMDVRALGNKAESGPADRVDAVLVER
jgi:outer membrane protein OmpA-like peptidoglycan-associated protein